ncbi:MAG: hypothetical protein ACOC6S_02515 [Chloroflexota bacterium]
MKKEFDFLIFNLIGPADQYGILRRDGTGVFPACPECGQTLRPSEPSTEDCFDHEAGPDLKCDGCGKRWDTDALEEASYTDVYEEVAKGKTLEEVGLY